MTATSVGTIHLLNVSLNLPGKWTDPQITWYWSQCRVYTWQPCFMSTYSQCIPPPTVRRRFSKSNLKSNRFFRHLLITYLATHHSFYVYRKNSAMKHVFDLFHENAHSLLYYTYTTKINHNDIVVFKWTVGRKWLYKTSIRHEWQDYKILDIFFGFLRKYTPRRDNAHIKYIYIKRFMYRSLVVFLRYFHIHFFSAISCSYSFHKILYFVIPYFDQFLHYESMTVVSVHITEINYIISATYFVYT